MTVFQHIAAIRQLQRLIRVLLDEEDGHSLLAQLFDGIENLLDNDRRQTQGRFIQQQQTRLAHQCTTNRQHLLFTAGHGARTLDTTLMQTREQRVNPLNALLKLVALGEKTAHRQVLFYRHTGKDATPFRDNRHRFTHDFRRLPVGNVFTIKHNPTAGGARIAA